MRDLNRTIETLKAMGHESLLHHLLDAPLSGPVELPFSSPALAKKTMSKLYDFLWFYPSVKARISLRLDKTTATLSILPKGKTEKRGRRPIL